MKIEEIEIETRVLETIGGLKRALTVTDPGPYMSICACNYEKNDAGVTVSQRWQTLEGAGKSVKRPVRCVERLIWE